MTAIARRQGSEQTRQCRGRPPRGRVLGDAQTGCKHARAEGSGGRRIGGVDEDMTAHGGVPRQGVGIAAGTAKGVDPGQPGDGKDHAGGPQQRRMG